MTPMPDWDWIALLERLQGLAAIAGVLDRTPLSPGTRLVSLERLAVDAAEATEIAQFVVARVKAGEPMMFAVDQQGGVL
ncbi:hypothetical protein [Streptomyces sp. NPDC051561]|uniref:hypothetical protein n=1 Tax=Streptomyces sp. NPDC051561 TaxID=3365658 RepID=UPI0037B9DC18